MRLPSNATPSAPPTCLRAWVSAAPHRSAPAAERPSLRSGPGEREAAAVTEAEERLGDVEVVARRRDHSHGAQSRRPCRGTRADDEVRREAGDDAGARPLRS